MVERWTFNPTVVGSTPTSGAVFLQKKDENFGFIYFRVLFLSFVQLGRDVKIQASPVSSVVERWTFNPTVVGSTPTSGETFF